MEVLADINLAGADEIICLGDIIGYGPDPEAVVDLLRERQIPCIMGNHEHGLVDESYVQLLNPTAQVSHRINVEMLSGGSIDYLQNLQPFMLVAGGRFVHGCPPDSFKTYMYDPSPARLGVIFSSYEEKICFVGHTHTLALYADDNGMISKDQLPEGKTGLLPGRRYIINIGSVGQPRDGLSNKAKYLVWDTEKETVESRHIAYNLSLTSGKIQKLGLPEINAIRLK